MPQNIKKCWNAEFKQRALLSALLTNQANFLLLLSMRSYAVTLLEQKSILIGYGKMPGSQSWRLTNLAQIWLAYGTTKPASLYSS